MDVFESRQRQPTTDPVGEEQAVAHLLARRTYVQEEVERPMLHAQTAATEHIALDPTRSGRNAVRVLHESVDVVRSDRNPEHDRVILRAPALEPGLVVARSEGKPASHLLG